MFIAIVLVLIHWIITTFGEHEASQATKVKLSQTSAIYVDDLSPNEGFAINGVISGAQLGYGVDTAGDINNDGYPDLILGAPYAYSTGDGVSYVLFGSPTLNGNINLLNLTTSNSQGFIVFGVDYQYVGYTVSNAGDINNDGFDDFMMGAYGSNNGLGVGYILFGKASGFSNIQLTSLSSSNANGFYGSYSTSFITSYPVTNLGDINLDGFDDVMISTSSNNNYVIYGKASGFSNLQLSSMQPPTGFCMTADWAAVVGAARGAGDINGDGYADMIIGFAYANGYTGITYVVYGGSGYFDSFDLTEMTSLQGFSVSGSASNSNSGYAVSSAGDVNADGIDDFAIGAPYLTITVYVGTTKYTYSKAGAVYIIYGKTVPFENINLAVDTTYYGFYNTSEGFQISGGTTDGYLGASLACAGDFNNDGFPDLVIGAYGIGNNAGATYLIYGGKGMTNFNIGSLSSSQGIAIYGATADDYSSWSVNPAGDLNQDDFDDIVIGAPNALNNYGQAYVIYGFGSPTPDPTEAPTVHPTTSPSFSPSISPTAIPTPLPTISPTVVPSAVPTSPTSLPTSFPTSPTSSPSSFPSNSPTLRGAAASNSAGIGTATIVGITVGCVFGAIAIALMVLWIRRLYTAPNDLTDPILTPKGESHVNGDYREQIAMAIAVPSAPYEEVPIVQATKVKGNPF